MPSHQEAAKPVLLAAEPAASRAVCDVMLAVLGTGLRLLHPFMPHLTEELNQTLAPLTDERRSLLHQSFPEPGEWVQWRDESLEASFVTCLDAVRGLRAVKKKYRVTKSSPEVHLSMRPELSAELATVVSTLSRCRVRPAPAAEHRGLLVQGHNWRAHVDLQVKLAPAHASPPAQDARGAPAF
ncbi:valine--tRNA ligase-like [Pollicipes pollicipes]|uniref:valine--tRNA ligase-like n=1 Tax=Pollicipes pollicipes TaxID=41117 RepID=UPI0018852AEE|nr:valine--tRNA ligase-like [Pollicipes pollicipes]